MTEIGDFEGRLALVTGAGDGIGEMLAKGFAGLGMAVCVQDIREDAANRVAREIGGGSFPLVFDISDRDACMEAASALERKGMPLSVLWLNAGAGVGSPLLDGKPGAIEWAFSVNVLGAIWTAQAFAPRMTDADGPRHVGVTASSAALRKPDGDFPLYALTKHGTFAVGETLRSDFAARGIPTTILCPGLLNTRIWDGARARPDRFGGARHMDPSISTRWDEAKPPEVMWPHIEAALSAGGGYLVCATDDETAEAWDARSAEIMAGLVVV